MGAELILATKVRTVRANIQAPSSYQLRRGPLWTDIALPPGTDNAVKVDGLPNAQAEDLYDALKRALAVKRLDDAAALVRREHQKIDQWLDLKDSRERLSQRDARWLTHEQQEALLVARATVNTEAVDKDLKRTAVQNRPLAGILRPGVAELGGKLRSHVAERAAAYDRVL